MDVTLRLKPGRSLSRESHIPNENSRS